MKKVLLSVACLGLSLIGLTKVSAKEVELTGDYITANNVYIVGNWVFQLNKYGINGYDIAYAGSDYTTRTSEKNVPVYYIQAGNVYKYDQKGVATPKLLGTVEEVFPGSKINATGLNADALEDLVLEEVEPKIIESVEELNTTAEQYGFESITYENNTVTFNIAELESQLAEYAGSEIINLFKSFVNGDVGFKKISYTTLEGPETKSFEDLTSAEDQTIKSIALGVLSAMIGEDASSLDYSAVANKSASATVEYEDEDGNRYTQVYTVKFVYDADKYNDKELSSNVSTLNSSLEGKPELGFSEIEYDEATNTATFTVSDLNAGLLQFAENTDIVEMFNTFAKGATKATYTANGVTKEFDSAKLHGDDLAVMKLAAELLLDMSGVEYDPDDYEDMKEKATNLVIRDVVGTATATFYYGDDTEGVNYTLTFVDGTEDDTKLKESELDESLLDYADSLGSAEGLAEYGFSGIDYDAATNTVTFNVSDGTKSLASFVALQSGDGKNIVAMFNEFAEGAESVTYSTGNIKDKEITLQGSNVIYLAAELLADMAGKTYANKTDALKAVATELTVSEVAGKTATATFCYDVDGNKVYVNYTLTFAE